MKNKTKVTVNSVKLSRGYSTYLIIIAPEEKVAYNVQEINKSLGLDLKYRRTEEFDNEYFVYSQEEKITKDNIKRIIDRINPDEIKATLYGGDSLEPIHSADNIFSAKSEALCKKIRETYPDKLLDL